MMKLRYELAISRIREMMDEETVEEKFRDYFRTVGKFILLIDETNRKLKDGSFEKYSMEELKAWNTKLYEDILADTYNISYGNPAYAVEKLGAEYGSVLSALYAEIRGAISYVYEQNVEYLDILFELFIEVYNQFEGEPSIKNIKDTIYWYASDYCDVFVADRIIDQVDANRSFAADIIRQSDLTDLRYLYSFGEYISDSELRTARHLLELDESVIVKMADVYTEGYRIGFVNTGKDLSKKKTVNIRYVLGFERVVKKAIENFEKMGLSPVIYRSGVSMLTKRQHLKIGYYGAIANKQYEYDHRDDQALFLDKKFVERKLEVMQTTYERCKDLASVFAGPACIEMFGEEPFVPEVKEEVLTLSEKQRELSVSFDSRQSQMVNNYIPGDERSFTIIAYPVPEIGDKYEEIFDEIIRINTLDAKVYEKVQQTLIDALDQGTCVRILGGNGNHTDLTIQLHPLKDREKETIFENCVADVNIPVGEVFTSPVLSGTEGVLHVSRVYLNELQYINLKLTFADGKITDYTCANFEKEEENRKYIYDNVLHNHETLPLGEFAIGTNTTAYVTGKKYQIEDKMPILIAEKTGPHFAVGDTCYSWSEDIKVYNPNGKEIIARDNEISLLRKEDPAKAYFQCHTDITIPYEELEEISVVTKNGEQIILLEDGRFVLPGTEVLNEPLDQLN